MVRIENARGEIEVRARLCQIRPGTIFVPFHYGYWDVGESAGPNGSPRAANELTITAWDPVSYQPLYKVAAVSLAKVREADGPARAPQLTAPPAERA